jgi:hypothetical protein
MENMIGNNYQLTNKSPLSSLLSSHSQIQNHADNEGRTVTALQTMVEWLCERPSLLLAERLQNLFLRLHQSNRNSVLVEITHGTIEKLLLSLPSLLLHNSTEPLFFFLFLGFQHTETVFHQVVTTLPRVFQDLLDGSEKTNSNNLTLKPTTMSKSQAKSKKILERLKGAVLFLTLKFPEFPQLYKPLSEWLKHKVR